jgi:uncharacterized protein with GYD domain
MPRYILLISWTEQGIATVKDSYKRAMAANKMFEQAGGKWVHRYYTMGPYDLVGVVEAKNDDAIFKLCMKMGAKGNIRTTTMRAWSDAEAAKILDSL